MFLVSSQDELLSTVIEAPKVIENGVQADSGRMHVSVLCVNISVEGMIVTFDEAARKAAPDALIIIEPFTTLQ